MVKRIDISTELSRGESWILDRDIFGESYLSDGMPATFDPFYGSRRDGEIDPYAALENDDWSWNSLDDTAPMDKNVRLILEQMFDQRIDEEWINPMAEEWDDPHTYDDEFEGGEA